MNLHRLTRGGLLAAIVSTFTAGHAKAQLGAASDAAVDQFGPSDAGVLTETDSGANAAAPPAVVGGEPESGALCVEDLGSGASRPTLKDSLPAKGIAGFAVTLEVVVEHGKGETVLPNGLRFQLGGDQLEALERAGFALPHPDGGAGPRLVREEQGERATTTVSIPLVLLPARAGRQELRLPPLPIAVARASGEALRLCTAPHDVTVDEPIANATRPEPQPNPPPRRQLEEWTLLKHVTYAAVIALLVGALLAWLILRYLRRPRVAPPPAPPRPPWEVALEELHDIRYADLVEAGRFDEHYDRVSRSVRKYLGGRFGFDGLESTTREMLGVLRRVSPPIPAMKLIETFLRDADLVKFARLTPSSEECRVALERGESIVRQTLPRTEPQALPALEKTPQSDRTAPPSPAEPGVEPDDASPGGPP